MMYWLTEGMFLAERAAYSVGSPGTRCYSV